MGEGGERAGLNGEKWLRSLGTKAGPPIPGSATPQLLMHLSTWPRDAAWHKREPHDARASAYQSPLRSSHKCGM